MSTAPTTAKRASTSAPSKRASTAGPAPGTSASSSTSSAAGPKPPLTAHPSAIVAAHASLAGTHRVTLGARCVLNPYSRVVTGEGPVVVGEGCVVWEKSVVGVGGVAGVTAAAARKKEGGEVDGGGGGQPAVVAEGKGEGVVLGRNVVVESGCSIEAAEVGEGTVVEAGCKLGVGCVVGKYCTLTPGTVLPPHARIPDFTVLLAGGGESGGGRKRPDCTNRDRPDIRALRDRAHVMQLDALRARVPSQLVKWQVS